MKSFFRKTKKAFTLVEVLLAIGVIAVSITTMIGLLASITSNISQIRHQNKATSLLVNLETTLRMKKFEVVYRWVSNPGSPYLVYFWDEYQNSEDPDNSSLMTMSSEMEGAVPNMPPTNETLARSEGEVYRVLLSLYQNGLAGQRIRIGDTAEYAGGGLPGDPATYALSYIPIKVDILVDQRNDIIHGVGSDTVNEQRRVYSDIITKIR